MRAQLHAKLSHALAQLTASTHEQMNQLSLIEADLRLGEPAIADESQRLEAVRGVCNNVRDRYAEVIQQGEKRLAEYRTKGEGTEIDEIVCSTTVVYNQLSRPHCSAASTRPLLNGEWLPIDSWIWSQKMQLWRTQSII